jgi:hypothetical protein
MMVVVACYKAAENSVAVTYVLRSTTLLDPVTRFFRASTRLGALQTRLHLRSALIFLSQLKTTCVDSFCDRRYRPGPQSLNQSRPTTTICTSINNHPQVYKLHIFCVKHPNLPLFPPFLEGTTSSTRPRRHTTFKTLSRKSAS